MSCSSSTTSTVVCCSIAVPPPGDLERRPPLDYGDRPNGSPANFRAVTHSREHGDTLLRNARQPVESRLLTSELAQASRMCRQKGRLTCRFSSMPPPPCPSPPSPVTAAPGKASGGGFGGSPCSSS